MAKTFAEQYEGKAFNRNLGWAFAAIAVWLLGLWLTAASILAAEGVALASWLILSPILLVGVIAVWVGLPKLATVPGCIVHGLLIVLGGIAVAASLPVLPMALATGRWLPIAIAGVGLPLALSAFAWISAPTRDGRAMLDRIAGFKQYLSITERDRLDRMQAPEDDLQLFERFLPYAIALEVENRWADRFTAMLAAAAAAQGGSAGFAWYSGSSSPWSDTGGFVDSIGSSLSSAISSASTAPGSSSGSGGGGSSGGGGGGGGGGGW